MYGVLVSQALAPQPVLALLNIWGSVWPYLLMLGGFSVIVFVHELGHFALAKWAGVKVDKFAIGFGREIVGFTHGETRYSFNVLPLGGYVKMLGQEDFDDKANELKFNDNPRSFVNKPVSHRAAIVSAGVVMNILFAFFLFIIVFLVGLEVDGTRIGWVQPDSPADAAGLLPGDNVKRINGRKVVEFMDVKMSVALAPPHEPIEFVVERADGGTKTIQVVPKGNQEIGRLQVGILPGTTREIAFLGPGLDATSADAPRMDDILVEVDGQEVTDENAVYMLWALSYSKGDVFVERPDPDNPDAPPTRVRVNIPPMLGFYPSSSGNEPTDKENPTDLLGLAPLVRFHGVAPRGRADLAGIEPGDTVLSWDDVDYPSRRQIARAVFDNPGWDMAFTVRKQDGRRLTGFIRPMPNKKGPATIQARCKPIDESERDEDGPRARFSKVRSRGCGYEAGIEEGDVVLRWDGKTNPSASAINRSIVRGAGRKLPVVLKKPNGEEFETVVRPEPTGTIRADYGLVAEELLRVGEPVETINGAPSPAAIAGIPTGALIKAVNGTPVARWGELIEALRRAAGTTVKLAYHDVTGQAHVADFPVPPSLRTVLGVGPEAQILKIDGRSRVGVTRDTTAEMSVGYHLGTRTVLADLVRQGKTTAVIRYRSNPLAEAEERTVEINEAMVDPWLGRVQFGPNINLSIARKILRGDGVFDAVRIGLHKTWYFIVQVYQTMDRMIFTRSIGAENISGPLGIVSLGGDIARAGPMKFLFFLGLISVNLAVINFLPLPIVDGGLMVFLIIEKIKGSPVSLRVQVVTQMIGLFLIIGTFLYVTLNDVLRLMG